MQLLGNVIWLVMGGLLTCIAWWCYGLLAFISIVGIPWGRACFVIGQLSLMPFGKEVVSRSALGQEDIGTGALGFIGNIIWFFLAGIWLALAHLFWGVLCGITIIGIPFALQHFKLAGLSLAPIGKAVVDADRRR